MCSNIYVQYIQEKKIDYKVSKNICFLINSMYLTLFIKKLKKEKVKKKLCKIKLRLKKKWMLENERINTCCDQLGGSR